MVRKEILKYVFIVQSGHIKILLGSRDQLFLFMSRNHLFVSFIVKCPILAYFCISHHEKKAATLLLLSKCPGSSEPACTETTAVCSSLQFPCRLFNAGHSGRCIIHGLPMSTRFQWYSQRLLLCFTGEDHKYKSCPDYAGKCEQWLYSG